MDESDTVNRGLLAKVVGVAMAGGVAADHGSFGAIAGRCPYPSGPPEKSWLFVGALDDMERGDAIVFRAPTGAQTTAPGPPADEGVTLSRFPLRVRAGMPTREGS